VAPNRKQTAREQVAVVLRGPLPKPVFVRMNAAGSGMADDDLEAIAGPWLAGVRLPKTEAPVEVARVADRLDHLDCPAGIFCLIESAIGVERAFEIARAHPRVIGIGLGEADLTADLGLGDAGGLLYARSRVVVAARAAGLPAPVQSVYPHIRDTEGLRATTLEGKRLGFFGRSVIHPSQISVVNAVFTPDEEEVAKARALVEQLERAEQLGTGAFALEDGRFVDRAIVEAARRVLAFKGG
jgi:citrate lyase subunit beta/citryl-CoA lyase